MKKTTTFVRILSALLATIMVAVAIPVQAIALPADELEQLETEQIEATTEMTATNASTEPDVFIVAEDTSKRGQFEKHYLCSDGTYVSVTYPEAIHYLDEDRTWKDVDQSLTYDAATGTYASERADFRVSFSGKASATNMAQIERNGHTLSWGIQTASKGPVRSSDATYAQSSRTILDEVQTVLIAPSERLAQVVVAPSVSFESNAERLVSNEDSFLLPNISAQISYADVFAGETVSLKYTVYHNKVEEDIIISERGDIHSVSMNMDVGTLTPDVNADGSVDLVDETNAMQFHVGIPYMMDADFSVCNYIEVTAEKTGTTCIITYTPNAEWFDSSERVFPILLDPSITTNEYVANMYDTYVEENAPADHSSEQFMYVNPNGENQRKAIVQIRKLPVIDASMPIVSAQLTLTTQYPPFSDVLLQAEYCDCGWDMSEYTYNLVDPFFPTFTVSSFLTTDQTTVWFDFTPHIYQMYADEANARENGDIYKGDFVIGFAPDATPTYVYPFYTSESTTPANRPVFKVKYGYALPAGMLDGGIYSFVNCGSYSHMTVHGTEPANNSNVYQIWLDNGNPTNSQKFKLEYVESTGGYLLRSMASSAGAGKVVEIQRGGGSIYSGRNVQIYSATDPISQEWLIVPVDYDVFRIVPRSNMSLTLTAYGYDDGTNTGKTATSAGNIFVKTFVDGDADQEWFIYDNTGSEVCTPKYRSIIETGNYYVVNQYTGRYLHCTERIADGARGVIQDLGEETVQWKIVNLGDGYCTIQRSDMPGHYLAPESNSSGSSVKLYNSTSEILPDRYKWSISSASNGGCLIRNKASGYYLYALDQTANPSSVSVYSLYAAGSNGYRKQTWYIAGVDDYVELDYFYGFNDIAIDIGETQAASVNKRPSNAYWANYRDFDYTIVSGSDCVSYNSSTRMFTRNASGVAQIKATHKTTGITRYFYIFDHQYQYELVHTFGFSIDDSVLILSLYDRVDSLFPNESNLKRAWKCSRLLGGLVYNNTEEIINDIRWMDVAGAVFIEVGTSSTVEKDYFVETLGFTEAQYYQLRNTVQYNYTSGLPDFAHCQISLAARLAYKLYKNGFLSNLGTFCSDEDISYLAGWLGDATLTGTIGTTSLANDDYCADLDAENTYRLIIQGYSSVDAFCGYYESLNGLTTRATVFLNYISFDTVRSKVFDRLIDLELRKAWEAAVILGQVELAVYYSDLLNDEGYHWNILLNDYPDTYNFLMSLQNRLAVMGGYA